MRKEAGFEYTFKNIQSTIRFQFEALGFYSDAYIISPAFRPMLKNLNISLSYPEYVGRKNQVLKDAGHLLIPEGTKIKWDMKTAYSDSVCIVFPNQPFQSSEGNAIKQDEHFYFSKRANKSEPYQIVLKNEQGTNKNTIEYYIEVIEDQLPKISTNILVDTSLYRYIYVNGQIDDDYGISALEVYYRIYDAYDGGDAIPFEKTDIAFNQNTTAQSFFYGFQLDSLNIKQDEILEYYVEVRDNDPIHNYKATQTQRYIFALPTKEEIATKVEQSQKDAEDELYKLKNKAEVLEKTLEALDEEFIQKKRLNWEDKKALEDLILQQKDMQAALEEMKKKFQKAIEEQKRLMGADKQSMKKAKELQDIVDNILDKETQKLMEDLQKYAGAAER